MASRVAKACPRDNPPFRFDNINPSSYDNDEQRRLGMAKKKGALKTAVASIVATIASGGVTVLKGGKRGTGVKAR